MNPANPEAEHKRKVAVFGGTFDPVHYGHLRLAEWTKNKLKLDRILFVPLRSHPFSKRKDITSARQRLDMLQLAISGIKEFEISTIELDREEISYTVDTLRNLHKSMPDAKFYFLIGDDNLPDFHKWKEPDEIRRLAKIVVFRREKGQEYLPVKYPGFIYLNNPLIDISSSMIRRRLQHGLSVSEFLPPSVYEYICRNRLYGIAKS